MKIAFDIGGVIGKYPETFIPMIQALERGGMDVYVLTDIPDLDKAIAKLSKLGCTISSERVLCADFEKYGERCKANIIKENGIDLLVDDHPGYCADSGCLSLFVWPNPHRPYEA
jgi:hypothetical protein